ncbi:MAG: hypothetical protein LBQ54_06815 [Planctomycetaceae bacterium]|jgi:hypothetical protein|nr:hypothetical protein [Planctomycetaceae bacterium]
MQKRQRNILFYRVALMLLFHFWGTHDSAIIFAGEKLDLPGMKRTASEIIDQYKANHGKIKTWCGEIHEVIEEIHTADSENSVHLERQIHFFHDVVNNSLKTG